MWEDWTLGSRRVNLDMVLFGVGGVLLPELIKNMYEQKLNINPTKAILLEKLLVLSLMRRPGHPMEAYPS